jgi:hypothetical protein
MALGEFGSTLNDELNRLANGGTYRDKVDMVDEALAAKQWANRENINPYSTDTVGILNEIAGLGLDKRNWLDFNGVCNYIAGTTGLPAAAALRQVYPTTDLLTGVASYYVDATDASASGQTITNLGTAGSLLPTTLGSSTAADSNDPKFLDHTGTNYVYHPGANSNSQSIPDSSALDITGDIDLRAFIALDDWTPTGNGAIIDKREAASTGISYNMRIGTTGLIGLQWSADGTTTLLAVSTVATGVTDGTAKWVRATLDVDNGAGGYEVKFFLSDNGTTWTQLGTTVTGASTTSIYSGSGNVSLGGSPLGSFFITGKYFRAQILNGIDGTTVLNADTSVITTGAATSYTALTGQTVTINRASSGRKAVAVTQPTWLFGTDDYMEVNNRYMANGTYLYLPGIASNFASTPDAAALDITGDIDIRVKVALDDWTPSAQTALLAKDVVSGGQRSYNLGVNTSGQLTFVWTTNGSTVIQRFSDQLVITDGTTKWVRVTLDVDNGASGYDLRFFTSDDGITWTQLGATQTVAGVTSIFAGTAPLEVGSQASGQSPARGKFFRAQVLNGIGGTVVFDANFESSITSLLQTSFTESSTNAATVTINRSGSTYRSAGITAAGYLYPGATNTFAASATDFLNFGAADSFTVLAVFRDWHWDSSPYIAKTASFATGTDRGYDIYSITTPALRGAIKDGTVGLISNINAGIKGGLTAGSFVRNVSTDLLNVYVNTTASSPLTDTSTSSLETTETLKLGRIGSSYAATELVAAAVFRQALTASQIRQISNYFANREVYL